MKTRCTQDQASLMDKWSSKPADHNTLRVRNNQRRHRARVKSRIEDLEACLAQTNAKLEAALLTINKLSADLDTLRNHQDPLRAQSNLKRSPTQEPASLANDALQQDASQLPPGIPEPGPKESLLNDLSANPAIYINKGAATQPPEAVDSMDCNCPGLRPAAPGESTMACSSAFQIIEQQNFSGVEVATIRAWLGPGFRKALRPGEACRVETNKLYELLDHITSPS